MAKIIVANWKMNPKSQKEASALISKTIALTDNIKNTKVIICPPFPYLYLFPKSKNKKINLGAQNVSKEKEGPFTGEVSPLMLFNIGVSHVIVGHGEERRQGETNQIINSKILNLLKFKLFPILCIGENKRDNEGFFLSFIKDQIKECLSGVPSSQMKNIIIAYEPIWAIGKDATREATREEFIEIKIFIKKVILDIYGEKIARNIPILYGGSVNPQNTKSFVEGDGADGLLVGRDSINSKKFEAILNALG